MQHDLFLSGHDLNLRSNFPNYLLRFIYSSFNASQKENYNAGKMNSVSLLSQKLLQKSLFRKTAIFIVFALLRPSTVNLRSNLSIFNRIPLK